MVNSYLKFHSPHQRKLDAEGGGGEEKGGEGGGREEGGGGEGDEGNDEEGDRQYGLGESSGK